MKNFNSRMTSGGFVMYSKEISLLISPEAAIIFGELVSWSEMKIDQEDYIEIDGKAFFMFSMDDMELETGLTPRRIRPVLTKLIELNLIERVRTGTRAQNHFHVVEDTLYNMLKEYEGTRRQRMKKIRADRRRKAKENVAEAREAAPVVKKARKKRQAKQDKPVKAAEPAAAAAPGIDDLLPSGMDQQQQEQPAAAPGMTLTEIIRDDQLGAIYEYIEVSYSQNMPVKLSADEIAEVCSYIRRKTNYTEFNPLDIDQAFYELAAMDASQVSKPTHFLGGAIAKAAGKRKLVNHAKGSQAAANKNRGELIEYLRAKDPNHVLVKRYDEEMKTYTR